MIPREHGAYGQLLFPMVTALALGHPGAAAFAWAGAATIAFLAHEPAMVLLSQRGAKASRGGRRRAQRWLAGYLTGVALLGALAVAWMPTEARIALVAPVSLGVVLAVVIGARREHTPGGEVLSAIVMASLSWPAALAAGVTPLAARTCAAVFAGGYAAATLAVHAVIARTRRPPATAARMTAMLAAFALMLVVAAAAFVRVLDAGAVVTVTPMAAGAFALAWAAPSARRLRTVGWTLIVVSAATTGLAVAFLRV